MEVRLMEGGGRWSVVHSFEDGVLRKRHGLQGPIDDASMDSFMMVAPTGQAWNESIGRWTTNEMAKPLLSGAISFAASHRSSAMTKSRTRTQQQTT